MLLNHFCVCRLECQQGSHHVGWICHRSCSTLRSPLTSKLFFFSPLARCLFSGQSVLFRLATRIFLSLEARFLSLFSSFCGLAGLFLLPLARFLGGSGGGSSRRSSSRSGGRGGRGFFLLPSCNHRSALERTLLIEHDQIATLVDLTLVSREQEVGTVDDCLGLVRLVSIVIVTV